MQSENDVARNLEDEVSAEVVQRIVESPEEKLQSILTNHTLGEKIVSYLSFEHLKTAQEVSPGFLKMVHNSMRFQKKAVLLVTKESAKSTNLFSNTQHNWHGMEIDATLPIEVLDKLSHLLESLEFVSFVIGHKERVPEMKWITQVLTSTPNLESLSVQFGIWHETDFRAVRLPALKQLKATINEKDSENFEHFLKNHPLLEELELSCSDNCDETLLATIQESSPKLRKLQLESNQFSGMTNTAAWKPLAQMASLRDFRITRSQIRRRHVNGMWSAIMSSLPTNQLDELHLDGIFETGFFNGRFMNGWPYATTLLQGFRNLRKLSFVKCFDIVDNYFMQFILREFQSLQELDVSHSVQLTNCGITGRGRTGGVSIQNLQKLTVFSIRACRLITPQGLLSCAALPFLNTINFTAQNEVSEDFVEALVAQNPRLETIGVNLGELQVENQVRKAKEGGRLLKIINLVDDWITGYLDSDSEEGDSERDSGDDYATEESQDSEDDE